MAKQPKVQDEALRELSEMFFADLDNPTPGSDLLDPEQLDYSLASLAHVDDFLDVVRKRDLVERDSAVVVLRAGAYVGEVIRRDASAPTHHWLDYDAAVKVDPRIRALGAKDLGLAAVLWDGDEGFLFPLAKVGKFLMNGREDSTRFFAAASLAFNRSTSVESEPGATPLAQSSLESPPDVGASSPLLPLLILGGPLLLAVIIALVAWLATQPGM